MVAAPPSKSELIGEESVDIQLDYRNFVKGCLPSGKTILTLFDSGASRSLLSQSLVQSSPYLSNLKPIEVAPVQFTLGNGQSLIANKVLRFQLKIQTHKFKINAYITPNLTGVDVILGTSTLGELNGNLDFATNTFKIRPKKLWLKPTTKVIINPGESKQIKLYCKVPAFLRNSEVIINANEKIAEMCPPSMLVKLKKGTTQLLLSNNSKHTIHLSQHKGIASIDLGDLINLTYKVPEAMIDSAFASAEIDRHSIRQKNSERYPHLDKADPLLEKTESEIIRSEIDLAESVLCESEKEKVYKMIENHCEAFSLYGELGACPNFEVDFELNDETPFFIRPYTVKESDKKIIDAELEKWVKLGVLGIGHRSYTSPVLLLNKRNSNEKRLICDLRHLNSRIIARNQPFPLLTHTLSKIGSVNAKVLSVLDLKSAFFCLPLSKHAQKFTGLSGYPGGQSYYFRRMAQGMNISPSVFQAKIDSVLREIPGSENFVIAHFDDIIIFSDCVETHKKHIELVLKALIKHGLKISTKKASIFRKSLIFMGHKLLVDEEGHVCVTPLGDRCTAIRNMKRPDNPKSCRRFCGMVTYLSSFLPRLQELLFPLHKMTRSNSRFNWGEEQEKAFNEIKDLLCAPPVLLAPKSTGKFTLVSDTSRIATGSYLMQEVNGKQRLIAYHSKRLPKACANYSVSELEFYGCLLNVLAFKHLLKGSVFDIIVDHSPLVQILKSKNEPCTPRVKKILERLSDFSFRMIYNKGESGTLVTADCLSRAPSDIDKEIDSIIPIAFGFFEVCYKNGEEFANPIVTRSFAKKQGIIIPDLFKTGRNASANKPEKTNLRQTKSTPNDQTHEKQPSQAIPFNELPYCDTVQTTPNNRIRTPPVIPKLSEPRLVDKGLEPKEQITEPTPDLYTPPKPIITKVQSMKTTHIPKQQDLNRMMDVIKRKIIHDFNLPVEVNEVRKAQLASPVFKPIIDWLRHGILPKDRRSARSIQLKAEEYIMCNGVLFRLFFHSDGDFILQLAVPESLADVIISAYHGPILAGHSGVTRCYTTMRKHFYMPNMFDRIRTYIESCGRCQEFRDKTDKLRPFHLRIPDEYHPFEKVSIDIKHMPESHSGFKYILVCVCEITRYMVLAPLKSREAPEIAECLIQKLIAVFGPPKTIISDLESSFTGTLVGLLCETLGINRKTIGVENHGSLLVERHIRTVSDYIKTNLTGTGKSWPRFVSTCAYSYNTFSSPYLGDHCPYYLVYLREPPNLTNLDFKPGKGFSSSYEDYIDHLKDKFDHISKSMLQLQRIHQEKQNVKISNKLSKSPTYDQGMLIYLYKPTSSSLQANSKKICAKWVGPLVVHEVVDNSHVILSTLEGKLLRDVFSINRLKPAFVHASGEKKNITHIQKLKELLKKADESKENGELKLNTQVPVFTDENGKSVPSFNSNQVLFLGETHPVDLSLYLTHVNENRGLAAPCQLDESKQSQLLKCLLKAPADETEINLHRARFKAGNLQVLVSHELHNKTDRYWWDVSKYPDCVELARQVMTDSKLKCSGTPRNFYRNLY